MLVWDVEVHQREMFASGDDVLAFDDAILSFGPVAVSLHNLARAGWVVGMRQRTPKHVPRSRPKIWVCPEGNRNQGFKIRPRSCTPYTRPAEVFYDIRHAQTAAEFSLSKFEVKTIAAFPGAVSEANFEPVPLAALDPFEALRAWNDRKVAAMDMAPRRKPQAPPPDNVVDLVDAIRRRDVMDNRELEERLARALG